MEPSLGALRRMFRNSPAMQHKFGTFEELLKDRERHGQGPNWREIWKQSGVLQRTFESFDAMMAARPRTLFKTWCRSEPIQQRFVKFAEYVEYRLATPLERNLLLAQRIDLPEPEPKLKPPRRSGVGQLINRWKLPRNSAEIPSVVGSGAPVGMTKPVTETDRHPELKLALEVLAKTSRVG